MDSDSDSFIVPIHFLMINIFKIRNILNPRGHWYLHSRQLDPKKFPKFTTQSSLVEWSCSVNVQECTKLVENEQKPIRIAPPQKVTNGKIIHIRGRVRSPTLYGCVNSPLSRDLCRWV